MATTPNAATATPVVNSAIIAATESWLKVHERLLLVLAFLVVFGWLGNKYLNRAAQVADAKSIAAQQQLTLDKQQLDALQSRLTQDEVTANAQIQQLVKANAYLAASVTSSEAALERAKAAVPQMNPTQLSQTWQQEVHLPNIAPTATGYAVGQAEAVATVQKLETAGALASQKTELQQEVTNDQTHIQDLNKINTDQANVLLAAQKENGSQVTACAAQVKALKADNRKSNRKWFIRGVIVGVVGSFVALHY
jgi:hypothetical protein